MARSPALLAFGGDSAVELLSAAIVFRRFYPPFHGERAERQVAKIAGASVCSRCICCPRFYSDAASARTRKSCAQSFWNRGAHPCRSRYALAGEGKTEVSAATGSAALRADAAQSAVSRSR
jgi:hypothetical protein